MNDNEGMLWTVLIRFAIPMMHDENCMCDACIEQRTLARVEREALEEAQRLYERRRGEPIGSSSVADAVRRPDKRKA